MDLYLIQTWPEDSFFLVVNPLAQIRCAHASTKTHQSSQQQHLLSKQRDP